MPFQWIAGTSALAGLVALLLALLILLRRGWFWGWLQGTLGLCALTCAILLSILAVNLNGYRLLQQDDTLATLSFRKMDDKLYKATLVIQDNNLERTFEMAGELWQLDAFILELRGPFARSGPTMLYKPVRLKGRYYALEDERTRAHSAYRVSNPDKGLSLFRLARQLSNHSPWFSAWRDNSGYIPMVDGALFTIRFNAAGLLVRPENDAAQDAIRPRE